MHENKKVKDILTEVEKLEISRLRLLLAKSDSIFEAKNYKDKIFNIIDGAKKRYQEQKKTVMIG